MVRAQHSCSSTYYQCCHSHIHIPHNPYNSVRTKSNVAYFVRNGKIFMNLKNFPIQYVFVAEIFVLFIFLVVVVVVDDVELMVDCSGSSSSSSSSSSSYALFISHAKWCAAIGYETNSDSDWICCTITLLQDTGMCVCVLCMCVRDYSSHTHTSAFGQMAFNIYPKINLNVQLPVKRTNEHW